MLVIIYAIKLFFKQNANYDQIPVNIFFPFNHYQSESFDEMLFRYECLAKNISYIFVQDNITQCVASHARINLTNCKTMISKHIYFYYYNNICVI